MTQLIRRIHHVTVVTGNAQKNIDFYTGILGLRLPKRTVNFDGPDVYHFYYGDETGSSGTILTFFLIRDWSRAGMGREIYNNMGHTINQDEIDNANKLIFNANV